MIKKKRGRPKKAIPEIKVEEDEPVEPTSIILTEIETVKMRIAELKAIYATMENEGIDSIGKAMRLIEQAEVKLKEISNR